MDVPPLCLGAMSFGSSDGRVLNPWALNEKDNRTMIKRVLGLDINFFTSANVYDFENNKKIMGRLLNDYAYF